MLFLGFSAGIPLLLIFSTLSIWLREAGIERSAVTFFSWAALGYSFKFVWAPLIDKLPIPFMTQRLGRRRAWMLLAQCSIITSILAMALIDPSHGQNNLTLMALATLMLGFSSATQDIVIDAYRIESAENSLQAMMSSTYIAGYRTGMLVAGAGGLFLASAFGSTKALYHYHAWKWSYLIMATTMLVGVLTTLVIPEPTVNQKNMRVFSTGNYSALFLLFILAIMVFIATFYYSSEFIIQSTAILSKLFGSEQLAGFLAEAARLLIAIVLTWLSITIAIKMGLVNQNMMQEYFLDPIKDFFVRYGPRSAILLLMLIGIYRVSDISLGVITNVFYQDMGFTKFEIAGVVKTFGLIMTITGGFLGGILSFHYGVIRILFLGAFLSATTNLLFMIIANIGKNLSMLYLVISVDNLSAGLASAAFVAFLSSLTNIQFTAMQYAIFSSLMTLFPKVLGGYSGTIVDNIGYSNFFLITALLGLPILILVWCIRRFIEIEHPLKER